MSLLTVQSLSKAFGGVTAIDDLTLAIRAGAIHSIIGPNGAGKTTFFNLVTGIYRPDRGAVSLDGKDITTAPAHGMAALGLSRTFQNLQIFFNMTAAENVQVGMHRHCDHRFLPAMLRLPAIVWRDGELAEKAAELMRFVGLADYIGDLQPIPCRTAR